MYQYLRLETKDLTNGITFKGNFDIMNNGIKKINGFVSVYSSSFDIDLYSEVKELGDTKTLTFNNIEIMIKAISKNSYLFDGVE